MNTETDLHSEVVTMPAYSSAYHRHSNSSGKFRALCCVKIGNAVISVYWRTQETERERREKIYRQRVVWREEERRTGLGWNER